MGLTGMQKLKLAFTVISAIVSMVLAIYAYASWKGDVDVFNSVVNNWKEDAIFDIQLLPSTSGCPPNYEQFHGSDFEYQTVDCDCSSSSSEHSTSNTKCTVFQRNRNCTDKFTDHTFDIDYMRGRQRMCVYRAPGSNALQRQRALPGEACPAGTKRCNYEDCVPVAGDCPITQVMFVTPSATPSYDASLFPESSDSSATAIGGQWSIMVRRNDTQTNQRQNSETTDWLLPLTQLSFRKNARGSGWAVKDEVPEGDLVLSYNNAGTLHATAETAPANSRRWKYETRQEIFWEYDCPTTRADVADAHPVVNAIDGALLAVLILSIIMGLIGLGLAWGEFKDLADDDPSNDHHSAHMKAKINCVFEIIILIPTIVALVMAFKARSFFDDVTKLHCTADMFMDPFRNLANEALELGYIKIVKTVVSSLYLFYRIYTIIFPDDKSQKVMPASTSPASSVPMESYN